MRISTAIKYRRGQRPTFQSGIRSPIASINSPVLLLFNFVYCLLANPANSLQRSAASSTTTCVDRPNLFLWKSTYSCGACFANLVTVRIISYVTLIAKNRGWSSKINLLINNSNFCCSLINSLLSFHLFLNRNRFQKNIQTMQAIRLSPRECRPISQQLADFNALL